MRSETRIWVSGHLAPNSYGEAEAWTSWNPWWVKCVPCLSSVTTPGNFLELQSPTSALDYRIRTSRMGLGAWSTSVNFSLCYASFLLWHCSIQRHFPPAIWPHRLWQITGCDISLPLLFGQGGYPIFSNWSGGRWRVLQSPWGLAAVMYLEHSPCVGRWLAAFAKYLTAAISLQWS